MGMSASQARLLSITSRLADSELSGQKHANEKIRLATDSDAISQKYIKALQETDLYAKTDYTSDGWQQERLTYNIIMSPNMYLNQQYCMQDAYGNMVVDSTMANAFKNQGGNGTNLEGFLSVFGGGEAPTNSAPADVVNTLNSTKSTYETLLAQGESAYNAQHGISTVDTSTYTRKANAEAAYVNAQATTLNYAQRVSTLQTSISNDTASLDALNSSNEDLQNEINALEQEGLGNSLRDMIPQYQEQIFGNNVEIRAINARLTQTYSQLTSANSSLQSARQAETAAKAELDNATAAWTAAGSPNGDAGTTGTANNSYATALQNAKTAYQAAQNAYNSYSSTREGGDNDDFYTNYFNKMCQGYVEMSGDWANNSEWCDAMLKDSGKYILSMLNQETGEWNNKSWSNVTNITEEQDDTKIAVAEAEYNSEMTKIHTKEKQIDNSIKKLDTEHNALQTEYDSVQKVIEKNIERTLKLFS